MRVLSLFVTLLLPAMLAACDMFDEKEVKLEGNRIPILSELGTLNPNSSLDATPVVLPDPGAPTEWPQSGGNVRHQKSHIQLAKSMSEEITAEAGDGYDWPSALIAAPIIADGLVYTMDASGTVAAAQAASPASRLWTIHLGEEDASDYIGGGLAYESGVLFATVASGRVVAMDAKSGNPLWSRSLKTPVRSAPAVVPGYVLVITVDSQLFVLDAKKGSILWRHRGIQETATLLGTVIPAVDSGKVVVAYPSGEIYALALRSGEVLWADSLILPRRTTALGAFTGVGGDPVIAGGMVYTVSQNGLLAANAMNSGTRVWEQPIASHNTPWVSGDFLYVVSASRQLVCLYRHDGRIKWVADLPADDDPEALVGPFLINNLAIIFGASGTYYAFNPVDGTFEGERSFISGRISPPAFAGGMMYLVDQDATLHIFR